MKTARRSFGDPYVCKQEWPLDCTVQCGGNGIVFTTGGIEKALDNPEDTINALAGGESKEKSYRTAFFEAFPASPACFIRGEGKTVEEAEEKCFLKYIKISKCSHPEFDRRNREDGYAFCTQCPYSGKVLDPTTTCVACSKPSHYRKDFKNQWNCKSCFFSLGIDEAVGPENDSEPENKSSFYESTKDRRKNFKEEHAVFNAISSFGYEPNDKKFDLIEDKLIHIVAKLEFDISFNEKSPELKESRFAELNSDLQREGFYKLLIELLLQKNNESKS
jgi:hypothetical protein